ncbi:MULTISPECIES: SGNH/GDSL hydrolase family protein [unclassified Arthrobacter]|uniref:SGNH/GDSL hydrolase family protein n=1 Tax=unclassified Arthrobacter TaxID=235627 RepID=UPI001C8460F4|nr:SGNH/GDSL hydrolase family protein [Arthrobacter sp. MAHUQ-56]MBX7445304.1 SGNH/GDSL hydrolase family protein [Arthrobacter sp. MAHUQ-56]
MPPATDRTGPAPARASALVLAAVLSLSGIAGLTGCSASPSPSALPANAAGALPGAAGATTSGAPGVTATAKVRNPSNGRLEAVVPDVGRTVLLIGDSQSEPADGWPRLGLAAAGYNVYFCGRGGTGFVAANGSTGNYIDALLRGDWQLPSGTPALIVIEGGGNDAASGAANARIVENAERLIAELQGRYPGTRVAMIGTLARGKDDGGGRRSEVDALLGSVAAAHGLPFVSVGDWLTRYGLAKDLADSVHMNSNGRRALGSLLERRLRELGLDRKTTPAPDQAPLAAVPLTGSPLQD